MKPFIEDKDLSRLLILIPYRPSISDPTIALLDILTHSGATCLKLPRLSDVGLARNLLAAAACEFIGHSSKDIDVVMWIDADMSIQSPDIIFRQLNHLVELDTDIRDGMSSVSGMYCRRIEANVLTASRVEDEPCMVMKDGSVLVPAHTGLGCFMQTAVCFLDNCQTAEQLYNERGQTFPAICKTGPRMGKVNGAEVPCWGQEDWWYCERLWKRDVAVYVDTSCPWGHLCESLTLPSGMPDGLLLESESDLLHDGGSSLATP